MKGDLEKLQGTWSITSLEVDGAKLPDAMVGGSQIIVKGASFDTTSMGATYRGKVTLNETKNPKTFDLKFTDGPEKGNTNPGIYKLDGDTWTLCIATRGKDRPKTFATKPGTGFALETLQRGKTAKSKGAVKKNSSAESPAITNPGSSIAPGTPAITGIHGEWAIVSGHQDGLPLEPFMIKSGKRIATGDEMTVTVAGQSIIKARYKIDEAKNPKTMDYVHTEGLYKGKTQAGIWVLDGKLLKICFSAPGEKIRPSDFSTKPGDGRTLIVWQLIKQ